MLDLNLETVAWQTFNFLVLFAALYFVLFRPTMARVRETAEAQRQRELRLEQSIAEAEKLRKELERRLASAEEEADGIVGSARDQAEVERATLISVARGEVERVLAEAHVDAYRVKEQALAEFRDELLSTVLDVAGLTIGRVAPDSLHDELVQQLCDTVWDMGQSDMRRVELLRQSLGDRTPTVVVRSAQPLTNEQQGLIARTFAALADRNVNIELAVEPPLGLGLEVRLGDVVLDNTIAGRFDVLRGTVVNALKERLPDG
ncbi:MAG: F0F1 ATP synthase subunit delta [Anaerolineae bacterium]|jgi:F-type H+-transporting ATPase subunit b|nr:F0F1 ATP synthase subunit delta [Anaerolineae bacterium]